MNVANGITGERFLYLNRAESIFVTNHARARIYEATGRKPTPMRCVEAFLVGRQLHLNEVFRLGYRPRAPAQGKATWYFAVSDLGDEIIAVVAPDTRRGGMCWITTYAPDGQTAQLRRNER